MNIDKTLEKINEHLLDHKLGSETLYAWIRSGKCPFGVWVRQEGNQSGKFIIFEDRMEAYLKGLDIKNV